MIISRLGLATGLLAALSATPLGLPPALAATPAHPAAAPAHPAAAWELDGRRYAITVNQVNVTMDRAHDLKAVFVRI
ncbi:hypothetical protein [Streptomyces sp. NPDC056883]|uniref:hypothetical protein n=1 Tax=Streptomyces sp. NPDC056883 TaxID=3345959 RepID=UPI0036B1D98A